MTKQQRISAFAALGDYLSSDSQQLPGQIALATQQNSWFTETYIRLAIDSLAWNLTEERLTAWLTDYPFDSDTAKSVGLILAGNLPLVGFHDVMCVLITGYAVQVKLSSADQQLPQHLLNTLQQIAPAFKDKIQVVDRLQNFDLVIATGSNNSARYFEHYFSHKPHIIRKNRNSIAVLNGAESREELKAFGHDLFDYFGLGCRNVSKVYIPQDYDIATLFGGISDFEHIIHHHKYRNNYDYNKSIYLINGDNHFDNGFLLLKPDSRIASPLAVLYYEEYSRLDTLQKELQTVSAQLQCVVSNEKLEIPTPIVAFGNSQQPALDDYADGINTLDFLLQNQ